MLSSLLHPSWSSRRQADHRSPFSSPSPEAARRDAPNERSQLLRREQSNTITDTEIGRTHDDDRGHTGSAVEDGGHESANEDGVEDETPLLPIFSAAHLGLIAVYLVQYISC
jgi:hypothetical protein